MSTINPLFTNAYRDLIEGLLTDNINIGIGAGESGQGAHAVAIGASAGNTNQGLESVAIGNDAGYTNQGEDAVAIGDNSGYSDQSNFGIAIGQAAGGVSQGLNSVAIGHAAATNTQGQQAVAVGYNAGFTTQSQYAVAIGSGAGQTSQGENGIAVGLGSGNATQGTRAVAIGFDAGNTTQGVASVAIGSSAGYSGQGTLSVAIGDTAGSTNQGTGAVAIGDNAGTTSQGANSIAIGKFAAPTSQNARSIMINATGTVVDTVTTDSCYITPIRSVAASSSAYPIFYNPTTTEVSYSAVGDPILVGEFAPTADATITFTTVPTWCKNVQVVFRQLVWVTTNTPALFLGSAGTTTTHNTTYNGLISSMDSTGATNRAGTGTGVNLQHTNLTTGGYSGIFNLSRCGIYSTFENWVWSYQCFNENGATDYFLNGAGTFVCPTAAAVCNTVQIKTTAGNFTGGSVLVYAW